jgi:hypothetical protein
MQEPELNSAVATVLAALVAAVITIWTFYGQRSAERERAGDVEATHLVTPFLFAAEDLQSRLYNLTVLAPDTLLPAKHYQYLLKETLYLVAQYFHFELYVLQYTPYGRDPRFIRLIQGVRTSFAAAHKAEDLDSWCIFRPRQAALGRIARAPASSPAQPLLIPVHEFMQHAFEQGLLEQIGISVVVPEEGELPQRSVRRLAEVQSALVDLVTYLERELVSRRVSWWHPFKRRALADFTIFTRERSPARRKAIEER